MNLDKFAVFCMILKWSHVEVNLKWHVFGGEVGSKGVGSKCYKLDVKLHEVV